MVALVHDHALHVVDLVAALANPNADWTELTLATIAVRYDLLIQTNFFLVDLN